MRGAGEGRHRHRRRDHRHHAEIENEQMRRHRVDAELDQRRRHQRRQQHVDAERRQAHAENDGDDGREHEQQRGARCTGLNQEIGQIETQSSDVEHADDDAGAGADQDDIDDAVAAQDNAAGEFAQLRPTPLIAGDEGQHGGGRRRQQRRPFRLPVVAEQRHDQDRERGDERPAGAERCARCGISEAGRPRMPSRANSRSAWMNSAA